MGKMAVTKAGLVNIRGILVPADQVRAKMLETGGVVVSDPEINIMLDVAMGNARKGVSALVIDAYPDNYFVPVWLNIHNALGINGIWLYFAVDRKKIYV